MLSVDKINVFYDDFHVLHDVSLEVREGEIVGVVSPNGHGKSTLLKAICGLIPIVSGQVFFRDKRVNGMRAPDLVNRGIVYVAEDRRLFPDMTVKENLLLGAFFSRGRQKKDQNMKGVYKLYPILHERQNQVARTLSGGEAQMLALGRGLMSAPDFLAIDEPSLGLAPNLVQSVLETIKRLNDQGLTILIVEQSLSLIEGVIKRIYRLEEGKIV